MHWLSIDVGTTSTKCLLINTQAEIVAESSCTTQLLTPHPTWVEQDPEELYQSVLACFAQLPEGAARTSVTAAAITNQRETVVAFRRSTGRALTNAISWMDTRTHDMVQQMEAEAVQQGTHAGIVERTGLRFSPFFSAFKMRWLLDNVAAVAQAAATEDLCLGTVDTWILFRLTQGAAFSTDTSNASRTFLLDIRTGAWDEEQLGRFGLQRSWLAEVRATVDAFGVIGRGARFAGVPVACLVADQQASLYGHWGRDAATGTKCTLGTGAFLLAGGVRGASEGAAPGHALLTTVLARFGRAPPLLAREAPIVCAGSLTTWLRDKLQIIADVRELDAILEASVHSPETDAVCFVPHLSGCLFPLWDAGARGSFHNLALDTDRDALAVAVLEGVAFSVRLALDALGRPTGTAAALSVDGGMSGNGAFVRLLAHACHVPVRVLDCAHATALGAAVLASNFFVQPRGAHALHQPEDTAWAARLARKYRQWLGHAVPGTGPLR